jgi:hypothetical protein
MKTLSSEKDLLNISNGILCFHAEIAHVKPLARKSVTGLGVTRFGAGLAAVA